MAKKPKIEKIKTPTYDIHVVYDREEYQTSEPDDGHVVYDREDYYPNRGDTSSYWTFKRLSGKMEYDTQSCTVSFKPIEGKTYYVLISLNNSGDSFGFDENKFLEIWDIYETSEAANKAEQELNNCKSKPDIEYTNHQGKLVKVYNPWLGMFSGCGDIRVEYLVYHDI